MSSHLFILLFTYCYSLGVRYIAVTLGHKHRLQTPLNVLFLTVFFTVSCGYIMIQQLVLVSHCNEVKITWLIGAFPSPG